MSHVAFLPDYLRAAIQDDTIARMLLEPLSPNNLWREQIPEENWEEGSGETKLITRSGVMRLKKKASTPRTDPTPGDVPIEQYEIEAETLDDAVELDLRQQFHVAWNETNRKLTELGRAAGTSVGRWARNRLFHAYNGGATWLTAQANIGTATLHVASLAGFRRSFDSRGRLSPISATVPLAATLGAETISIVAALPADADKPNGAGTLTLAANLAATHAIYVVLVSSVAPKIIRIGGGTSTRALTSADLLTLASIESAVAYLRQQGVPTFPDGRYRVHLSPEAVRQLRRDADWKAQIESVPDNERVTGFEVGRISGCTFLENAEAPSRYTVDADEDFPGAVTAAQQGTVNVGRVLISGAEAVREHRVPELGFATAPGTAQWGVKGAAAQWIEGGNYAKTMLKGILFAFRAPQDQKGERLTVTYSWTGDFGVSTDNKARMIGAAAYRRAVVVEHADLG